MLKRRLWRVAQRKPYSDYIAYMLAPLAIGSLLVFSHNPTLASIGFFIFGSISSLFEKRGRILAERRAINQKKIKRLERELMLEDGQGNEDSIGSFLASEGVQTRAGIAKSINRVQYTHRRRVAIMGETGRSEEIRPFSMGSRSS